MGGACLEVGPHASRISELLSAEPAGRRHSYCRATLQNLGLACLNELTL
jgi:hypothetical protein